MATSRPDRRLSKAGCAAGAAALVLVAASPSGANGRFPSANQIVFSPVDANLVVLRATFGILISRDAGATWVWLCEDALGISSAATEDPSVCVSAGGSLIAGTSRALEVSPDLGCNWGALGGLLANEGIVDVALRPDAPHSIVALQSSYDRDAGGAGYVSQIFESRDDGVSWSPLGARIQGGVVATTLDVAPSDPNRLYVAATRFATDAGPASASLFVSVDRGANWTERPLPALEPTSESAVFIGAVDPTNADIVYLRSGKGVQSLEPSRLFVTRNAGQSFQVALALAGQMLGFALSPDGKNVYAGGPGDGLLVAASGSLGSPGAFAHVAPQVHVQCLATHGSDLWACSDELSGFVAAVARDGGASFTPKLHFVDIKTPIACPSDAAGAQCSGGPFLTLCRTFGDCPTPDSGPSPELDSAAGDSTAADGAGGASGSRSASPDGGAGSPGPLEPSGGCSTTGGGTMAAFAIALLGAAAVATRRRR